jgi:uncharacterized protein
MHTFLSRIGACFAVVLLIQSCQAQKTALPSNKDDNSLLWEISGKDLLKPSYLFGTFHIMCKEDIRLSPNLQQALKGSQELYLEMDMDDPSNTLGALFFMNMKKDTTLKDLLSENEYARLEKFFKDSAGMQIGMFGRLKPFFLEALLYPKYMRCKKTSGMEEELMKLAKENKQEIKGFETIAMQAAVFDSIPYREQVESVLAIIDSLPQYRQYFDTMMTAYIAQQLTDITVMLTKKEFGMDDHRELMLDRRNIYWVRQLNTIMKEKNIFIGVGAAHLVGEKGLIQLLKKEGYTLRPILNK